MTEINIFSEIPLQFWLDPYDKKCLKAQSRS